MIRRPPTRGGTSGKGMIYQRGHRVAEYPFVLGEELNWSQPAGSVSQPWL